MKRVYLDSNVLISLIKSEMGKPFKLMYQKSEDFLCYCKGKFAIVISDLSVTEISVKTYYSQNELVEFLRKYGLEIIVVTSDNSDFQKSREFEVLGIHFPDSLHIALALKAKADFIVTWNIKDFLAAGKIIMVKEPQELI